MSKFIKKYLPFLVCIIIIFTTSFSGFFIYVNAQTQAEFDVVWQRSGDKLTATVNLASGSFTDINAQFDMSGGVTCQSIKQGAVWRAFKAEQEDNGNPVIFTANASSGQIGAASFMAFDTVGDFVTATFNIDNADDFSVLFTVTNCCLLTDGENEITVFPVILNASYSHTDDLKCGNNLYYSLNEETGTLTISGFGEMYNYSYGSSPFFGNSLIKNIVFEDGITSVGEYAFYQCEFLESLTLPDSVCYIKDCAFNNCSSLESITVYENLNYVNYSAFEGCCNLQDVYYSGTESEWNSITIEEANDELLNADIHFNYGIDAESITVLTLPSKTVYHIGEDFDTFGMVIGAHLSNGKDVILNENDLQIDYDFTQAGEKTVYVTYLEKTAEISVTVTDHNTGEWIVTRYPDAENCGTAERWCEICGEAENFTFENIFTSCYAYDGFIYGLSMGMTPELFRNECISGTDAAVTFSIGENETIGTGTKVTVSYENGLDVEYEFLIYGDVNGDGYCDGRDALIVNCIVNGMLSDEQTDYVNWVAADCSHDGEINEADVELLCSAGTFNAEISQSNIV